MFAPMGSLFQRCLLAVLCWMVAQPAIAQTGTFIDRQQATDLRVVSYNVLWDTIFSDVDPIQAAKFERVVQAVDADIWNLQEIGDLFCGGCTPKDGDDVRDLLDNLAPLESGSWHVHQGRGNVIASKYPLSMTATDTTPAGDRGQAIALVDLPDASFDVDFYFMNNHYKCCGEEGGSEDQRRQQQSDAIVNWLRDARTPGGFVDLPSGTPFAVLGDLNMVGGLQPLQTLLDGNIIDEFTYGADSPPDWDGTHVTDVNPMHNGTDPNFYTWRNDNSSFDPGILDFVIYSDSVVDVANNFVLNTVTMSPADRLATGLQEFDITVDLVGDRYDHLPLIVDFRFDNFADSDYNQSGSVDGSDLTIWESGFGSGTSQAQGDGDLDGDVDALDYLKWQREYTGAIPAVAAVPEPQAFVLVVLAGMLLLHTRR